MKGIVLAGGTGSRLWPLTSVINKHLLPVWDKPLVFYPISSLIRRGIWDIALISSPTDLPLFTRLLSRSKDWGVRFTFIAQKKPSGIGEVATLAKRFVGKSPVTVILGDNLFLPHIPLNSPINPDRSLITTAVSANPEQFGVVYRDTAGKLTHIAEKPPQPQSNQIVTGLYVFSNEAFKLLGLAKPARGEKELSLTTGLNALIKLDLLDSEPLPSYIDWKDCGTIQNLSEANSKVYHRSGRGVGSPELAAKASGLITESKLVSILQKLPESEYRRNLAKAAGLDFVLRHPYV